MRNLRTAILALSAFLFSAEALAGAVFTYHGRIQNKDGAGLESDSVTFVMRIYGAGSSKCLLYEESRTLSMVDSKGVFSIAIGEQGGNRTGNDPNISMEKIFDNDPTKEIKGFANADLNCHVGTAYRPSLLDKRIFSLSFKDNHESNSTFQVLPEMDINFVPLAVTAHNTNNLGGKSYSEFLRVDGSTNTTITPGDFTELLALIRGDSTRYSKAGQMGGAALPANIQVNQSVYWNGFSWSAYTPITTEADPTVKSFAKTDLPTCAANHYLVPKTNGSGFDCIALPAGNSNTGTVESVSAGTGLRSNIAGNGAITSTGTLSVDVGTTANKIVQLDASGRLPALDGSLLTNVQGTDPNVRSFAKANLPTCLAGYYLVPKTDGTGFECVALPAGNSNTGTVESVSVGTGLRSNIAGNGAITSTGTLSVDVGTTANKIVQLDGSGRLPALDGSQLTNIAATTVSSTTAISTTNNIQTTKDITANRFIIYNKGGIGPEYVGLKASDSMIADSEYSLVMPLAKGQADEVLKVVSVTGKDIQLGWGVPEVQDSTPGGTAGGDLSGTYPNPVVSKLGNVPVELAGILEGQSVRYESDGKLKAAFLSIRDLRSRVSGNLALNVTCTAGQSLQYSSASDSFTCENITLTKSQISDLGTLGTLAEKSSVALNNTETTGILPLAKGGTGLSTMTPDRIVITNTSGALGFLSCTSGNVLGFNATGVYGCYAPADYGVFALGGNNVGATALLGTRNNYGVSFITNNLTRLSITNDGKVGIGKAPTHELDVQGTVNADELRIGGEVIGRGMQDPVRKIASLEAGCTTVGELAKTASGDLLVCDEDTSIVADADCSAFGVGAMTFGANGDLYVCAQ